MKVATAAIHAAAATAVMGASSQAVADPGYFVWARAAYGVPGVEATGESHQAGFLPTPLSWSGTLCANCEDSGCGPAHFGTANVIASPGYLLASTVAHKRCGHWQNITNMYSQATMMFDDVVFVSDASQNISVQLKLRLRGVLHPSDNPQSGLPGDKHCVITAHMPGGGHWVINSFNPGTFPPAWWTDNTDIIVTLPARTVPTNTPTTWQIDNVLVARANTHQQVAVVESGSMLVTFPPAGGVTRGEPETVFIVPEGVTVVSEQANIVNNTWTEPSPPCPADIDGDGLVSSADLGILLGAWGSENPAADLDNSGAVGSADLAILLGAWGVCD